MHTGMGDDCLNQLCELFIHTENTYIHNFSVWHTEVNNIVAVIGVPHSVKNPNMVRDSNQNYSRAQVRRGPVCNNVLVASLRLKDASVYIQWFGLFDESP